MLRTGWYCFLVLLLIATPRGSIRAAEIANSLDGYNVVWDSPSKDSSGSMPIGNGDIALNVWAEKEGDLLFYIAKTDAFSENGELLKLGLVRVKLSPNPFGGNSPFRQELHLRNGQITFTAGTDAQAIQLRIWVDANHPVIHVDADAAKPVELEVSLELWRTAKRTVDPKSPEMGAFYSLHGGPPVEIDPDTVMPAHKNQVAWYHRNERSIYPETLRLEHLEPLLGKYPDPLLHRTFGAAMFGSGLVSADEHTLKSSAPANSQRLSICVLTANTDSIEQWQKKLDELASSVAALDPETTRLASEDWWDKFWNRSWINITGSKDADAVSQGYAIQRFMIACNGRGSLPAKFNGGLFTVDATVKGEKVDADYRSWGSSYWFQNSRHLYWPTLMAGDEDILDPFIQMYVNALPLARDRTQLYYHHGGACFQETVDFWGLPNLGNFGWDNPGVETKNSFIRHYWSGALELTTMMLDRYDNTQDAEFAHTKLVPFADAITTFYDQHWKRDPAGKIHFEPAQALETWQTAVNPLPDIAGLKFVLPRLLALPDSLTTPAQRSMWQKTLNDLPPLPTGIGRDGNKILLPAEKVTHPSNSENPEQYAIFPYRLYGVGLPNLQLGIDTFNDRRVKGSTCWTWDVIVAARFGLTTDAKKLVTQNFTAYGSQRFRWFWRPGHDWIPDLDNGGSGSTALQRMLMQCEGRQVRMLPAWPTDWDCQFKLHAPYQTTVEGKVRAGKVVELKVTPEDRRKDLIIMPAL